MIFSLMRYYSHQAHTDFLWSCVDDCINLDKIRLIIYDELQQYNLKISVDYEAAPAAAAMLLKQVWQPLKHLQNHDSIKIKFRYAHDSIHKDEEITHSYPTCLMEILSSCDSLCSWSGCDNCFLIYRTKTNIVQLNRSREKIDNRSNRTWLQENSTALSLAFLWWMMLHEQNKSTVKDNEIRFNDKRTWKDRIQTIRRNTFWKAPILTPCKKLCLHLQATRLTF